MNNNPPLSELLAPGITGVLSPGWAGWFSQVFRCLPWKQGFNQTATLNFGSTNAQTQTSLTVTVTGARTGDAVWVTPTTDVSGFVFTGVVTSDNTVTVYAKNITVGAVDPASQVFRIIILQN